jgi:hypothetical protein
MIVVGMCLSALQQGWGCTGSFSITSIFLYLLFKDERSLQERLGSLGVGFPDELYDRIACAKGI